jgi:hypothetical protein
MNVAQLTDLTLEDISDIKCVFALFVKAQTQLESDSFASGSTFVGHVRGICHRIEGLKERYHVEKVKFELYLALSQRSWHRHWLVFVLQTILNPSVRFDADGPVDEAMYDESPALLKRFVNAEIQPTEQREAATGDRATGDRATADAPSDDFVTHRPSQKR